MGWWLDRRRSETGGGASRARGRMGQHQSHREKMCLFSTYAKLDFLVFFPKATAKGSFEKSITIKDCRSDRCLERLSSKTAEVITVLKDCHQRLPK